MRPRFVGLPTILFALAWLGVMGLVTFVLWNVLMPAIFRLPAISFWQGLGLFLLSRVLFGRFTDLWGRVRKARFVHGWGELTPEERQRVRSAMGPRRPGQEGA